MSRTDWTALVTRPSAEYAAVSDLARFGLNPYLPQVRRLHLAPSTTPMLRRYPLFPRYLFLPFRQLDYDVLRNCRTLLQPKPVLADALGRPWRAPLHVIEAVRRIEAAGTLDESPESNLKIPLKIGDKVRINNKLLDGITAFIENSSDKDLHVLMPLLGGARVRVARASVTKA
jgi:hypothetical protein